MVDTSISLKNSVREISTPVIGAKEEELINLAFIQKGKQLRCQSCNRLEEMIKQKGVTQSKTAQKCKECKNLVTVQRIRPLLKEQLTPHWRTVPSAGRTVAKGTHHRTVVAKKGAV